MTDRPKAEEEKGFAQQNFFDFFKKFGDFVLFSKRKNRYRLYYGRKLAFYFGKEPKTGPLYFNRKNKGHHIHIRKTGMEKLRIAATRENMDAVWEEFSRNPNDIRLRNRLVERYMHIVKHHAERIHTKLPGEIELDDLISAGTFGLIDAVQAFQLDRGVKFETFCVTRIRGAMLDELRSMDWVPRMVRSKASKLNEAYKVLEGKFGRKPSEEELSRFLEVPVDEVKKTITDSCRVNLTSLDKNWSDQRGDGDVSELDLIPDRRGEDPTERMEKTELIRACTKGLTKNERLIIILYYFEEMTMKEIGATLDLSESRVSQMHSSIVERIKSLHNNRRFDI